jgi:RND family efflux transporter MFP subunit
MNTQFLSTTGLGLVLAASLAIGCKRHDDSKGRAETLPVAKVRVQVLEARKWVATEDVVGTVRAKLQARLEAKIAGRIEQMRPVPGQSVKAGELLVRLDAQEIRAKLDQATAVHQQAASELKRTTALLEHGAATRSEFDAVQARERVAAAAVKETQTTLGYAEIVAPFDGIVTRKHADVGDLAAPGKALLELEAPTALRVEADVGEALIAGIQPGQILAVHVATLTAALQGTVAELAPAADSASRTFLVKLDLPPTPGLRAGSFARVAIPTGEREALAVPVEAVIQRGQLEYIFIVADGRAQLRIVKTGRRHGQEVELLAGASMGEQVVVSGSAPLRDGQPLQIQP